MKVTDQLLSLDKCKHLNAIGIENKEPLMIWMRVNQKDEPEKYVYIQNSSIVNVLMHTLKGKELYIKAFTVSEIIDMLPKYIMFKGEKYNLISYEDNGFKIISYTNLKNGDKYVYFSSQDSFVNPSYDMLRLIKLNNIG